MSSVAVYYRVFTARVTLCLSDVYAFIAAAAKVIHTSCLQRQYNGHQCSEAVYSSYWKGV